MFNDMEASSSEESNKFISIEEFFDLYDDAKYFSIPSLISEFSRILSENMKYKMLERMTNENVEYDIQTECDKFIEWLMERTGKTKEELAKLI